MEFIKAIQSMGGFSSKHLISVNGKEFVKHYIGLDGRTLEVLYLKDKSGNVKPHYLKFV